RGLAQHANCRADSILVLIEKPSGHHAEAGDVDVTRLNAINDRHFASGLRSQFGRDEPLARRSSGKSADIGANGAVILERQPRSDFPSFLNFGIVVRLLCFHDHVAHTHLLDIRHDLLLRACADGKHGNNCGHAEDHSQHGEERTQLVGGEVLQAELHIGNVLDPIAFRSKRNQRGMLSGFRSAHLPPAFAPEAAPAGEGAAAAASGFTRATSGSSGRSSMTTWLSDLGFRSAHLPPAFAPEAAPAGEGAAAAASGFTRATSVPSGRSSMTTWLSDMCLMVTERDSKPLPVLANTTGLPARINSAWRGR